MPSHYDLLVIDLDGTLLSPDGSISPRSVEAVVRARETGLPVMIATGRALVESNEALTRIGHTGPVVTAGGAMLCDATTGRTVHRHAMPSDLAVDVSRSLIRHGHKALLLKDPDRAGYDYLAAGPADLDPNSQWWFETMPIRVRFAHDIEEDPHPDDTVRVGAVAQESDLAPIADWMKEEIGDRGFLQHWAAVTASHITGQPTHLLEVFNPNVSKWTMVSSFCQKHGIPRGRVAAIGDGLNDVEIVREAGLGVAMGNADERVRVVADRVTETNAADGVATAIDRMLEGEW